MKHFTFLLVTTLMITMLSCDPPKPENLHDYTAVVELDSIQHSMDIHASLFVLYDNLTVDYDVESVIPAVRGKSYVLTVNLYAVDLPNADHVEFGVQQGYTVSPIFNEFTANIYMDGALIETVNYTGPDSDFDIWIYP